jgi:hypothetical protein
MGSHQARKKPPGAAGQEPRNWYLALDRIGEGRNRGNSTLFGCFLQSPRIELAFAAKES